MDDSDYLYGDLLEQSDKSDLRGILDVSMDRQFKEDIIKYIHGYLKYVSENEWLSISEINIKNVVSNAVDNTILKWVIGERSVYIKK